MKDRKGQKNECIREGILKEFLMKQKAEVVKVSIYEFDEEREMRLIREDESYRQTLFEEYSIL